MKRQMITLVLASLGFASFAWAQTASEFKGHTGLVMSVAFDKDGKNLATAGFDGSGKIWDAASGKTLQTIKASDKQVNSVGLSPDGTVLASGGAGNIVKPWNPQDGEAI